MSAVRCHVLRVSMRASCESRAQPKVAATAWLTIAGVELHRTCHGANRASEGRSSRKTPLRAPKKFPGRSDYPDLASGAEVSSFLTDRTPGTARASSTARERAA